MDPESSTPNSFKPIDCPPEKLLHDLHLRQIDLEFKLIELEVQNEHLRSLHTKHEESLSRHEQAKNYYADLFNNAPVAYLTLSDKGIISDANHAASELFDINHQNLLSRCFASLISAQNGDRWYLFCRGLKNHMQRANIVLSFFGSDYIEVSVLLDCLRVNSMLHITLTKLPSTTTDALLLDEHTKTGTTENESTNQLCKIAKSLPGVIFQYCLQPDGRSTFPFISDNAYNILRLSPEELKADTFKFLYAIHPNDYYDFRASLQQSANDLTPWDYEFRVKFDDGTTRWLLGNALPEREADGSTHWHGIISDITQHRQIKNQLRLDNISLNVISQGVLITDANHNITWANDAFQAITGYNKTEIVGQNCRFLQGPFTDPQTIDEIRQALANLTPISCEILNFRKEGGLFWNELTITPLFDKQGKIANFISTTRDITERKRLEKQLSVSHSFNLDIINSLSCYIAVLDFKGNIIVANKIYQDFCEQNSLPGTQMNMLGLHCVTSCTNMSDDGCIKQNSAAEIGINEVLSGKQDLFELEYQCHSKTQLYWFHLKATLIQNSPNFLVISYDDVTERKQNELIDKEHLAQLAHITRLGLMGEMASGLAHEVNQPLAAIGTYAQVSLNLLKNENPDLLKLAEVAAKTQVQVLRAGKIIHQMKDFCKTKSQQRSTTDINELINDSVNLCVDHLKQNSITITLKLDHTLPHIAIEHIQIEQVLINLIRNGIDAIASMADKKQGEISIQSYLTPNHEIQVRVKDNGPGIQEDQKMKILTPFHTTKAEGMGMGLSISRSLIEAHKGTLHFNSQFGKGSTFYFTLPI